MKTFKTTTYGILLICLTLIVGCSSDDDNTDDDPSGASGQPHQYDVTIGDQHFSGEIDNVYGTSGENGAISGVSIFQQFEGASFVTFTLKNNDFYIYGGFEYPNGENDNITISQDGDSEIIFSPSTEIGYSSEAGTANVDVGQTISIVPGAAQFAQLNIQFNGTFSYENQEGEELTTQASGTIIVNLPPGY